MPSLSDLLERFGGVPIPNCPGRYVLRGAASTDGPDALCASGQVTRHDPVNTRDAVVVTRLDGWGLISYERADGTWLHTANSAEGFERKLAELGIPSATEPRAPSSPVTSLHRNQG